jgi:uncharacterized protein (DUF302 family)
MAYNYSKNLRLPFEEVVVKLRENLVEQGFAMISTMDMRQNLKTKLGVNFRNYRILSTCHPLLSYKAISLEPHIGVLLPCNIVVQEHENGEVEVSALNPLETIDQNMITPSLEFVALEISDHLRTAIDSLRKKNQELSFSYN